MTIEIGLLYITIYEIYTRLARRPASTCVSRLSSTGVRALSVRTHRVLPGDSPHSPMLYSAVLVTAVGA